MSIRPCRPAIVLGILVVLITQACKPGPLNLLQATPTTTANDSSLLTYPKATPYALQPAAGICASSDEETITIQLNSDMPDPRCSKVRAEQELDVINNTPNDLQVSLGVYNFRLAAGKTYSIDRPFSDYLEAGVHQLQVVPCCSAEIWLEGN